MTTKGYDDSPPRNGVIFFYTVLTVVVLFGTQKLLDSYFANTMDAEYRTKVYTVGLDKAVAAKAHDREVLEKSGIEAAMRLYAQRGRSASAVIQNESGANKPAIAGWSQLKRVVAEQPAPAAVPEAVPVPASAPTDTPPEHAPAGQGGILAPRSSGATTPQQQGASTRPTNNRGANPQPVMPATRNQ